MIIDIHAHPFFLEMLADMPAPAESEDKNQVLDLISDPSAIGMAIGLMSKSYFDRGPSILALEDFRNQMEIAGIDVVAFQVALIKGDPAKQINEQAAGLISKFSGSFVGFAGFDPNTGEQAVADIEICRKRARIQGYQNRFSAYGIGY